ncbi:hypothetical protein BH09BAC5_BH09BAC5_14030 [soil metagenome]
MKIFFPVIFALIFAETGSAQILNVPQVIQEQNQWCWAGCSKCILDYYALPQQQCDIADYARNVITWYNFGSVNCCVDPSQGCNYWNYNYGSAGSIQDILVHFGNIQNYGISTTLSQAQITTEVQANHVFVIRWGWYSGGGHFVVGHGINGNDISYMNPWFGEGLHVSTYAWLVDDGVHAWTHTNVLTSVPTAIEEHTSDNENNVFPNPAKDHFTVTLPDENVSLAPDFILSDVSGRVVFRSTLMDKENIIGTTEFADGIYFYQVCNGSTILQKGKVIVAE